MSLLRKNNSTKKAKFDFSFFTADPAKERKYLFENISLMLASGIDILDILSGLKNEIKASSVRKKIDSIESDIQNGEPIWSALLNAKLIPEHLLAIVKIGEESGRLPENLNIVLKQRKKDDEFRSKIRSASMYPALVLIVMFFVGLGIAFFVLPRLTAVYKNLRVELPFITRVLISIGDFMQNYGYIFVPSLVAVVSLIFYILFIYKKTKHIGESILFGIPILKRLIMEVEMARLGYLLGTLIEAGIPIPESLKLIKESTSSRKYKKLYTYILENIEKGFTFKQIFEKYPKIEKLVPLYPREAIITGEKTGGMGESLKRIGKDYEKKNEATTKDFSTIIEPVLLIVVWLGVGFIAFSVVLPIYSLVGDLTDISRSNNNAAFEDEVIIDNSEEEAAAAQNFAEQAALNEEETAQGEAESGTVTVIETDEGFVPIRDSVDGNEIAQAASGDIFKYTEKNSGWYKVSLFNGSTGWINEIFLDIQPESAENSN